MPMIDVYGQPDTFADPHTLAAKLAETLMGIEEVPKIPMFRKNTAAFIHDLPTMRSQTSPATATTCASRR
jgi:hypothetical protein